MPENYPSCLLQFVILMVGFSTRGIPILLINAVSVCVNSLFEDSRFGSLSNFGV